VRVPRTASWLLALAGAGVLVPAPAPGHELRPAYLELRQRDVTDWEVSLTRPARGARALDIEVRLPEACRSELVSAESLPGARVDRWRARCRDGLHGGEVAVEGLARQRTDVLVRILPATGADRTLRLTRNRPSFRVSAGAGPLAVARTYGVLGVEHILLGPDHLMFVLALLLLVSNARALVGTITAFTVAHSLTLAAASLGLVHVPSAPVEAAIALSIVFVAVEIVHAARGRRALAARRPWVVAFLFGLLHGLGFAGALREVGLPADAIPLALLSFNLGVEAGQLLFVGALYALFGALRRAAIAPAGDGWAVPARLAVPGAYAIGIPSSYWLLERTARFWS